VELGISINGEFDKPLRDLKNIKGGKIAPSQQNTVIERRKTALINELPARLLDSANFEYLSIKRPVF